MSGSRFMLDSDKFLRCLHGCLICIWMVWFYRYYARVLGKGLELLSVNGGRLEMNQLLFTDDTALVADSDGKLCRQYAKEES